MLTLTLILTLTLALTLPQGPMHVVVLGAGDCAKAPLQLTNP